MDAMRFYVSGRVQGVFFRASTVTEAQRLGLIGWAKNLADGRVEVLALGTRDALDALAQWLESGPPLARVKAVESGPADPSEYPELKGFKRL